MHPWWATRRGWAALLAVMMLALASTPLSARSAVDAPALPVVTLAELPPEARRTVRAIREGGPFAYERDGVVFGNFERLLPRRERGYYREYTVATPGLKSRGARRIVAGGKGELYYTDDHYATFKRVTE